MQHIENLFRRYKGQLVNVKTVSGGIYSGKVSEISNDYVGLIEKKDGAPAEVFLFFQSLESMIIAEVAAE